MVDTIKLASCFILFGLSVVSGIISCLAVKCLVSKLGSSSKFKRAISILNCFSGGVFFATSVLHLLPEARESMEQALEEYDVQIEYPFTELAMCVGFFLILSLEHFAHSCCASDGDESKQMFHKQSEEIASATGGIRTSESVLNFIKARNNKIHRSSTSPVLVASNLENFSCYDDIAYQTVGTAENSIDNSSISPYSAFRHNNSTATNVRETVFKDSDRVLVRQKIGSVKAIESKSTHDALEETKSGANQDPVLSKLRGLVLLIALSLHMIFGGLALGLLKESRDVWELLIALSLHKFLVFFTIGVQTLESLTSLKKTVIVILFFALMSPCGIIIGMSITLSDNSVTKDMLSALLQSIATGTFLFVTFFEILQRELGSNDHDLLKVFTTVIGFALVAASKLLEDKNDH